MKICSKCKDLKSFENFFKGKGYKDGYRGICKKCVKEHLEERKEERKEYLKKYKTINKQILKLKNKEYRKKNSDKIK